MFKKLAIILIKKWQFWVVILAVGLIGSMASSKPIPKPVTPTTTLVTPAKSVEKLDKPVPIVTKTVPVVPTTPVVVTPTPAVVSAPQPAPQPDNTQYPSLPLKAICVDGSISYQDDASLPNYRGMCSAHSGIATKLGRTP